MEESSSQLNVFSHIFLKTSHRKKIDDTPNVDLSHTTPGVLSLRLPGIAADKLMSKIRNCVAISSGSTCSSKTQKMSHVLKALGLSSEEAKTSLRISFGTFLTTSEVQIASDILADSALQLCNNKSQITSLKYE